MKLGIGIAGVMLAVFGLWFFTSEPAAKTPQVNAVTMQRVESDMKQGGILIDVRTPEEYAAGHVDKAVNLSLQDIEAGARPGVDKTDTVYVYCRSGSRASQAKAILERDGYTDVINLGGVEEMTKLGGKIVN